MLGNLGQKIAIATLALSTMSSLAIADIDPDSGEFDPGDFWQQAEEQEGHKGYWHTSFGGGVMVPIGNMSEAFSAGLAANLRIGYTSKFGLGLAIGAGYSPLPRKQTTIAPESHLVLLTALPRFTIGRDLFRMWVGAGGGVVLQRTDQAMGTVSATEPVATGEAGLEMHLFSSGGISILGSYSKSFGRDVDASLFSFSGGLVFTF